jgi:glycolate oxidase FAD binding subunit
MPTTANKLISGLKEAAGKAKVIQDKDKIAAFAMDGKRPKVVVSPGSVEEVSRIVAFANQQHLSVIPVGNGTKVGMGSIPEKMDIVLSTRRLNRITDCDIDNLTLTVQSGMTLNDVQKHLAKEGKGYFLPLDPPFSEKATLGGIVATNSSGPRRFLYGTARDLIIGMKAVFPNGDVVVSGGKTVKNVSGYDLCKLLIGSFGTLGVLCEMTFKLLPLPEKGATVLVPFKTLEEADGFVQEILHSQLTPASIETMNAKAMARMRSPVSLPEAGNYIVAIGMEGVAEAIERGKSEIVDRGKKVGALEVSSLESDRHVSFWTAIRDFSKGLGRRYPDLVTLKSNFLISKSGKMIESYERIARGLGFDFTFISHSGNGILYAYALPEKEGRPKVESLVKLVKKMTAEAVKNEGNLVVESSPLSIRKKVDVWGRSRSDALVMRRIKKQIDPAGILNPGRFVGGI